MAVKRKESRTWHPQQKEFETWFGKMWGGIRLTWYEAAGEYRTSAAQAAWEAWRRGGWTGMRDLSGNRTTPRRRRCYGQQR